MKRNEMYKKNALRAAEMASFGDYNDYLKSLEMHAVIDDFIPVYLARITQLTNKSNQFNVTTRRYTPAEMESVFEDDGYIRLYGKLIDKFGDNGVVSVVIGRKNGTALDIDLWLMSCRVLKRDMEFAMLDRLVERCREAGGGAIGGCYPPQKTRWSATARALRLYENRGARGRQHCVAVERRGLQAAEPRDRSVRQRPRRSVILAKLSIKSNHRKEFYHGHKRNF